MDLGTMSYRDAHQFQLDCVEQLLADSDLPDHFLLVEHPPVFTLGRRGERKSLLVAQSILEQKGIDLFHTERGGDITYHGPGQIVLYPVIGLRRNKLSVRDHVRRLEKLMIQVAVEYGVVASRDERNPGVWVGNNKIGSIGISIRHGVAFHGMALNVTTDLEPFSWINPCGLTDVGATSLSLESGKQLEFDGVKQCLTEMIGQVFAYRLKRVPQKESEDTYDMFTRV